MKKYKKILTGSVLSLLAGFVLAAPGDLDTSFGVNGVVATGIGLYADEAKSVLELSDHKLVVAGVSCQINGQPCALVLARYHENGSLDVGFNGSGFIVHNIGNIDGNAKYKVSLLQQPDGKLVVGGTTMIGGGHNDFMIARFNINGTLDTTFGGVGFVYTDVGGAAKDDYGNSLILQPDGKLVLAGKSVVVGPNEDFSIARYNSDGSLDTTFNVTGKKTFSMPATSYYESAFSLIAQTDGKLVVAGHSGAGADNHFIVARLNSDGSIDSSFNGSGFARITIISGNNEYAESLIQQADGKLVALGQSYLYAASQFYFAAIRINLDGSLDSTFNNTGKVVVALGSGPNSGNAIVQQSDGKLVGSGWSSACKTGCPNKFGLVRFNADGALDATFGSGGLVIQYVPNALQNYSYSLIQLMNGKLLLAGSAHNGSKYNFVLTRYLSGQPDTDADGVVDGLDADDDNDGINDNVDNCRLISNATQANTDNASDGGNACDTDDDNDSVLDVNDAFPLDPSETLDTDGDGTGNNADSDDDGDGYVDALDAYPLNPYKWKFPSCDFDGDSDSDILVRDLVTKLWKIFKVQSAVVTSNTTIGIPDDVYTRHIAAIDSDGDGDKDILTRNSNTGLWTLYEIDNGNTVAAHPLALYAHADWNIVATGDFNGDAVDDVLLRDSVGGSYRSFLLGHHGVAQVKHFNGWLSSESVDQGVGDFDGDGTDDLLVRRSSDHLYFIFKVLNGDVVSRTCVCNLWKNPDWSFQFASDMNADGTSDIVIRGTGPSADGKWWRFQMNNRAATNTAYFNLFYNKDRVKLGAVGDYNGDGTNDVILRVDDATTYVAPVANGLVTGHGRIGNFGAGEAIEQ